MDGPPPQIIGSSDHTARAGGIWGRRCGATGLGRHQPNARHGEGTAAVGRERGSGGVGSEAANVSRAESRCSGHRRLGRGRDAEQVRIGRSWQQGL
jgi:hypothetical protein